VFVIKVWLFLFFPFLFKFIALRDFFWKISAHGLGDYRVFFGSRTAQCHLALLKIRSKSEKEKKRRGRSKGLVLHPEGSKTIGEI